MSRNIYEPTPERRISQNRGQIKNTHQKPEAFRWIEPDCIDSGDTICTGTEPILINSFAQPTVLSDLERFAFRLNADGKIQTKGFLDVSGAASGTVAWVMSGIAAGEEDYIPPTSNNDGFTLRVTTTGGMGGVTNATAHIDRATGDVTLTWVGSVPWARISRRFADSNQTIATGSFTEVDTTTDYNMGAGESGEGVFTVDHTGNFLTIERSAVVLVHCRAYWFSSLTNPWILWVNVSMSANLNEAHFPGLGGSTDDAGDLEFHTRVRAGTDFSFGVRQQDGANRSLDAAMLDIMVIGDYTGTDFDAMDPDFA